jgi:hypothetical protein
VNKYCWIAFVLLVIVISQEVPAQNIMGGTLHGNFQLDAQYYFPDSAIDADTVKEKLRSNGFANFIYDHDKFSAGLRYENYETPLIDFENIGYKGSGIPYRFITYRNNELEVTAGNYYEQFGSGVVFRSYEDRGLGYDNAMDGFRVKYHPYKGVYLKGVIGKQRLYFAKGEGMIRGADAEWNLNESLPKLDSSKTKFIVGGSFVSKYQQDNDPIAILPENVGTGAGRINVIRGGLNISAEYAQKINDPSETNHYIYKTGSATILNLNYSQKGFGLALSGKRIDNMSFRSERTASLNNLIINYLPAMTKNHTYILTALYPYASQPNGEYAMQAETFFHIKPAGIIGGKFGADINLNYSRAQNIDVNPTGDDYGYTSDFFTAGREIYFEDFNIEFRQKLSKKIKYVLEYVYIDYNRTILQGSGGHIFSHVGIAEINWKLNTKKNIRTELQHLYTKQDKQSWALWLVEYSISPHWFLAAFDQYNYGNEDINQRFHYYTASMGYTNDTNRIQLSYGRQRAGIFCVGGVCRQVPASTGFLLSITSSF